MNLKKMIKALIKVYSDRSQFDVSLAQSPLEEGLWFRIFKKIFIYLFIYFKECKYANLHALLKS